MLFAFLIALAHNTVHHSHDAMYPHEIFHEQEAPHFELSDLFSGLNHFGSNLAYTKLTKKITNRVNLNHKVDNLFNCINVKSISNTKPIHLCIRDNPDLYKTENTHVYSLRGPPILIS